MNPKLGALSESQGGVFSRRDALACGYNDVQIHARVRAGAWIRLQRGAFASAEDFARTSIPPDDAAARRHLLRTRAALIVRSGGVVASHQSAAVAHELPSWGLDLTRVHLTRTDNRASRCLKGVSIHRGWTTPVAVTTVTGIAAAPVARTVVETATLATFEVGVVVADAALHSAAIGASELTDALEMLGPAPGARMAAQVVDFADPRSESVGESRLRVLLDRMGLPVAVPQYVVHDRSGDFVGRVDFGFPAYSTVIEFDGKLKYREDAASVVVREKEREDRLREAGYEVVRITWSDLDDPHTTAIRIVRALRRGRQHRR